MNYDLVQADATDSKTLSEVSVLTTVQTRHTDLSGQCANTRGDFKR